MLTIFGYTAMKAAKEAEDLKDLVNRAVKVIEETPGIGRELIMGWIEHKRASGR